MGKVGIMKLKRAERGSAAPSRTKVLISANAFWNIANFRAGLIRALSAKGYQVTVATPNADADWAAARGIDAVAIAIDRSGLNPIRDASTIFSYTKLIQRIGPNIFLGFTPKPNIYGSLAASACGIPSIPNVSGLGTAFINRGPLSALVSALYRIAFRKCPIVFFQNRDDSALFVSRKIVKPGQVRLLPGSGVDCSHFSPMPPSTTVRFLFVGRLLGDKGVREFVEAAQLLRSQHPEWRFQLLGALDPGNRSAIRQAEIDRWVGEGTIEHVGHVSDVRPYIADATAVVLPSYREGLPRSLLEAAAMGRSLIATDVPGNRHIVQHGVNGLLCTARDSYALAEAIKTLGMMDRCERDAMGRAGRALVEREFGEETVISAYLEAIAQLCLQQGS
jgi:glycosyltransferase involved in cell wall biosynthesis